MSDPPKGFTVGVPIPEILFSAFQSALRTKLKSLAKDIAATLGQPEDPLITALLSSQGVRPYLVEEPDEKESDLRCSYRCTHPDSPAVLETCGEPILWTVRPTKYPRCVHHAFQKPEPPRGHIAVVRRIEADELDAPLYQAPDGTVYTGWFEPCGYMAKPGKMIRLVKADE